MLGRAPLALFRSQNNDLAGVALGGVNNGDALPRLSQAVASRAKGQFGQVVDFAQMRQDNMLQHTTGQFPQEASGIFIGQMTLA